MLFRGDAGQANAWVARGQRLIENLDCIEHGYLQVVVSEQQLLRGDAGSAHDAASQAASLGERFAHPDVISMARHVQGRALIQQGQILGGLGRLDEAMLAVVAGEVSPICTGLLYCSVIESCRDVYALSRAQEWTAAFSRMCEQHPQMVAFTDTCLVHRAEIMQFRGAWPDAMAEAVRVCERCRESDRKPPAAALYQQGEIHRLRGEFAKADAAYRAASEHGAEPQPGLALLRLEQGRIDSANAALNRLMCATSDPLRRAGLLPAHLEVMLASGDLQSARAACSELHKLAELLATDVLRAAAAQGRGAIELTDNDAAAALDPLRRAFELWTSPRCSARLRACARSDRQRACRTLGDTDGERLEVRGRTKCIRAARRRAGAGATGPAGSSEPAGTAAVPSRSARTRCPALDLDR